ncbi:hypothetical protein B0H14DRAFT_3484228 [Mycena olivaceomarginata]|nr:hypothetical protein B0H14DRAFT_3484228 [Mycena olivaceomarginata]
MPPKQLRSLSICTCSAGIGDTGPSGCAQEFRSLRCALGRPVHGKRKTIVHELIQPCTTSTLGIDSQRTKVRKVPQRTKGHLSLRQIAPMTAMASPTNMTSTDMIPELDNTAHDPRFWCLPPVRDESSEAGTGNFPMYLVTQGRSVGVWHNWTVVKAMDASPSGSSTARSVSTLTPRNLNAQQLRSDQFQAPSGIADMSWNRPSRWTLGKPKRLSSRQRHGGDKPRVLSTANYDKAQAFSEGIYWVDDD